jgi:hypothetical protein
MGKKDIRKSCKFVIIEKDKNPKDSSDFVNLCEKI